MSHPQWGESRSIGSMHTRQAARKGRYGLGQNSDCKARGATQARESRHARPNTGTHSKRAALSRENKHTGSVSG